MLERALRNIYERNFQPMTDIERNLFHEFCRTFNRATDIGLSQTPHPDDDFRNALRHNNAVFAAFKTHRLQNDVARQLTDSNGNLKTFEQWKNDVRSITSHQCDRWLRTEYDTAVLRARQAANWQQFIREADVLPNLKWIPSTSPNPGKDHQPFWNTVLPIAHDFWNHHRPGDRWNCKCELRSTDEPPTAVPNAPMGGSDPQPGLDNNPGIDAKIFADSHPYIANAYPGAKQAVEKAVREMEGVYREEVVELDNGGIVRISNLVSRKDSDYDKIYQVAELFAKMGKEASLTPKKRRGVDFDYDYFYGSLKGTKFYGKCPDIRVKDKNGKILWYEHEGFTSDNPKRAFSNMMNHGLKQSSRIIIDKPDLTDGFMIRSCYGRINKGYVIDEVWIREQDGKIRLLFRKDKHLS